MEETNDCKTQVCYQLIMLAAAIFIAIIKGKIEKVHALIIALSCIFEFFPKHAAIPSLFLIALLNTKTNKRKCFLMHQEFINYSIPTFYLFETRFYPNKSACKLLHKLELRASEFILQLCSSTHGSLFNMYKSGNKTFRDYFELQRNAQAKRFWVFSSEANHGKGCYLALFPLKKFYAEELSKQEQGHYQLLNSLSEEIMNELNHIIGFLSILNDSKLTKELEFPVKISLSSANQVLTRIHDLLDYVSIKTSKFKEFLTSFNVNSLFEELFDTFKVEAKVKGILITFNCSDSSINIMADYERLKQVMTNLIQLSLKSNSEGSIKIDAYYEQYNACFAIELSGPLNNRENIAKLFMKKTIISENLYSFGLYACRLICDQIKIKVETKLPSLNETIFTFSLNNCVLKYKKDSPSKIYSRLGTQDRMIFNAQTYQFATNKVSHAHAKYIDPLDKSSEDILEIPNEIDTNEGSSAYFKIPTVSSRVKSQASIPKFQSHLSIPLYEIQENSPEMLNSHILPIIDNKIRKMASFFRIEEATSEILIVDDDQFNRMVVAELFREKKVKVMTANNGMEAINIIKGKVLKKDHSLKLILMDINMPVIDGISCSKMLVDYWESMRFTPISIIALSASISDVDCIRGKKIGIKEFIHKPITCKHVEMLIDKYIKDK